MVGVNPKLTAFDVWTKCGARVRAAWAERHQTTIAAARDAYYRDR